MYTWCTSQSETKFSCWCSVLTIQLGTDMTVPFSVLCHPLDSLLESLTSTWLLPIPHFWWGFNVSLDFAKSNSKLVSEMECRTKAAKDPKELGHQTRTAARLFGEEWRRATEKLYILAWSWIFVKSGPAGVFCQKSANTNICHCAVLIWPKTGGSVK